MWMSALIAAIITLTGLLITLFMGNAVDGTPVDSLADINEIQYIIVFLTVLGSAAKDMQTRNQKKGTVRSVVWPILLIGVIAIVLNGCGAVKSTVAAFKPAPVCADTFEQIFYVKACEADRLLDSAYAEVNRQKARGTPRAEYQPWLDKINSADDKLATAGRLYAANTITTFDDVEGLESVLDKLEVWVDGN